MNDTITLPAITPNAPLVLADASFLSTLASVEKQATSLVITDAQSAQAAADLQTRLTMAGKRLEAARESLKRPFIEKGREIDAAAREPAARIEKAKSVLKSALTAYDVEQERIAREAEQKRQAELARLEKIRLDEEAEAKRKGLELVRQLAEAAAKAKTPPPVMEMEFDDAPMEPPPKTETEKAIEAVKYAPAVVAQKPSGIRYKVTLKPVVVDVNKLPDMFVTKIANLRGIISTFCAGWKDGQPLPVLDGVKFEIDRTTESTGRAQF